MDGKDISCGGLKKAMELVVWKLWLWKRCEILEEVRRVNDTVMADVSVFEDFDELKSKWNMHTVEDSVVCMGDISEHMGRHTDGYYGVHIQINLEGRMLPEFSLNKKVCISTT